MKQFRVEVPPTMEQGSHTIKAKGSLTETMKQNALWDYNSARDHDNLPPLKRMPKGTRYIIV